MISLSVPSIPPSANHAYFNNRNGGRTLAPAGKKYIRETKTHLVQNFPYALNTIRPDRAYLVYFRIYFESITNKLWPKEAKTRYKTIDASNRIKLLEDALKEACGIDDAQHLMVVIEKKEGPPLTEIFIWNLEEEATPLDAIRSLNAPSPM